MWLFIVSLVILYFALECAMENVWKMENAGDKLTSWCDLLSDEGEVVAAAVVVVDDKTSDSELLLFSSTTSAIVDSM